MPTILGVNVFWGGGLKPWAWRNSAEKLAGKIQSKFAENGQQFSQNSPDQIKKITTNPLCKTSGKCWKGPKGIPGKAIGKNTPKTTLKLPEDTLKAP